GRRGSELLETSRAHRGQTRGERQRGARQSKGLMRWRRSGRRNASSKSGARHCARGSRPGRPERPRALRRMEGTGPDRRAELDGSILIARPDAEPRGREGGLATRGNSKNPHAWYSFGGANQLNLRRRSSLLFQVLAIASERATPSPPGAAPSVPNDRADA